MLNVSSGFSIAVFSPPYSQRLTFHLAHTSLLTTPFCQCGLCNVSLICFFYSHYHHPTLHTFNLFPELSYQLPQRQCSLTLFIIHSSARCTILKIKYSQIIDLLKNIQQSVTAFINSFIFPHRCIELSRVVGPKIEN